MRPVLNPNTEHGSLKLAEGEGFEPPEPCGSPVFKTGSLNHSDTPPKRTGLSIGEKACAVQAVNQAIVMRFAVTPGHSCVVPCRTMGYTVGIEVPDTRL